jgi:hypothetical protein
VRADEAIAHCRILREILGDPFHPATIDPTWLTSTVVRLADVIYEERAFDLMPYLDDALEQVGCTSAEILGRRRSGAEHIRGCWALDLILGKA